MARRDSRRRYGGDATADILTARTQREGEVLFREMRLANRYRAEIEAETTRHERKERHRSATRLQKLISCSFVRARNAKIVTEFLTEYCL